MFRKRHVTSSKSHEIQFSHRNSKGGINLGLVYKYCKGAQLAAVSCFVLLVCCASGISVMKSA